MTPRCRYVFDWIFDRWGIKYTVTSLDGEFGKSEQAKIRYARQQGGDEGCVWIADNGLLKDDSLKEWSTEIRHRNGIPYFFCNEGDTGFDIFSAVFFMLSRYEEYRRYNADKHGRFPASESLSFKNRFLEMPIVDIWIDQFKLVLREKFPGLVFADEKFDVRLTFDIDQIFKYSGRSIMRHLLAMSKDFLTLEWKNLWERSRVLTGIRRDPWDIYDAIRMKIRSSGFDSVFFILCGERSEYDRNTDIRHKHCKTALMKIQSYSMIGLHPSYRSSEQEERILAEKKILEKEISHDVEMSRQHFLRFRIPDTFAALEKAGIQADYSMAFPDAPGFRAGTAHSFYFYDIRSERQTSLKLMPSCWMDSTFVNYLDAGEDEALEKARMLIRSVKNVNGNFVPVFHNSFLGDYRWMKVFDEIIHEIVTS